MPDGLNASAKDPLDRAVLEFQRVAEEVSVEALLVGAYARDIFLREKTLGLMPRRTLDVDFAVLVDSWTSYSRLKNALIQAGSFMEATGQSQRVLFEGEVEIDLIPFGGVASEHGILSCWPDDFRQEMDVSGFEDALRSADFRELHGTRVRCATPEAFVVLKLLSWNSQPERTKDAMDLAYMVREYVNLPRVMEMLWATPNDDLLEKLGGDLERQGARLLGRNIGLQFPTSTTTKVRLIIEREIAGPSQRLVSQMLSPKLPFDKVLEALADLRDGLDDVGRKRDPT